MTISTHEIWQKHRLKQFEIALADATDPCVVLRNPSSFLEAQLFQVFDQVREGSNELVIAEFRTGFARFMAVENWRSPAMVAASFLPQSAHFHCSIDLLGVADFESGWIDFFIGLLCVPSALSVLKDEFPSIPVVLDRKRANKLSSDLLGLIRTQPTPELLSLFNWFVQFSPEFVDCLDELGSWSGPIFASMQPTMVAACWATTRRLLFNIPSPFNGLNFVVEFLSHGKIESVPSFCQFAAGLALLSALIEKKCLATIPCSLRSIFSVERVRSMAEWGCRSPDSLEDHLAYLAMTASPFVHLPNNEIVFRLCLVRAKNLQLLHKIALIRRLFHYSDIVIGVADLIVLLLGDASVSKLLHNLLVDFIKRNSGRIQEIADVFVRNRLLSRLVQNIDDRSFEISAHFICCKQELDEFMLNEIAFLLKGLFESVSHFNVEFLLMIVARLVKCAPAQIDNKVITVVELGLKNERTIVRCRAALLTGDLSENLCVQDWSRITDLLFGQLGHPSLRLKRLVVLAIGNLFFHVQEMPSTTSIECKLPKLVRLLKKRDQTMLDNTISAISNIVRKSDRFLGAVMKADALQKLLALLEDRGDQFGNKIVLGLQLFCQYEAARVEVRALNVSVCITRYEQAAAMNVRRAAIDIIKCLC
jgi:hypothetical protein